MNNSYYEPVSFFIDYDYTKEAGLHAHSFKLEQTNGKNHSTIFTRKRKLKQSF